MPGGQKGSISILLYLGVLKSVSCLECHYIVSTHCDAIKSTQDKAVLYQNVKYALKVAPPCDQSPKDIVVYVKNSLVLLVVVYFP